MSKEQLDAAVKALIESGVKPRGLDGELFNLANAYNQAADLAVNHVSATSNADMFAPAIMCRSFAIELLLKFFIAVEYPDKKAHQLKSAGIDLYGHRYSELFDRVSSDRQAAIAAKYSEVSKQEVQVADFRRALIELGDDPFVGWRYAYESRGDKYLNLELLAAVTLALGLAAQDVRRAGRRAVNQDSYTPAT